MIIYPTMKKANRQAKRRCKTLEDWHRKRQWDALSALAAKARAECMNMDNMLRNSIKAMDNMYMNRNSIGREEA